MSILFPVNGLKIKPIEEANCYLTILRYIKINDKNLPQILK